MCLLVFHLLATTVRVQMVPQFRPQAALHMLTTTLNDGSFSPPLVPVSNHIERFSRKAHETLTHQGQFPRSFRVSVNRVLYIAVMTRNRQRYSTYIGNPEDTIPPPIGHTPGTPTQEQAAKM